MYRLRRACQVELSARDEDCPSPIVHSAAYGSQCHDADCERRAHLSFPLPTMRIANHLEIMHKT